MFTFFGSKWNFNNLETNGQKICHIGKLLLQQSICYSLNVMCTYMVHSLQNPLSCLQMSVWVDKIGWWNNLLSWFTNSLQDLLWFREQHFVYLYICTLKISLNCKLNTNYTSYIYIMYNEEGGIMHKYDFFLFWCSNKFAKGERFFSSTWTFCQRFQLKYNKFYILWLIMKF